MNQRLGSSESGNHKSVLSIDQFDGLVFPFNV